MQRTLGLRFDEKTGDLYIADAYFGLLVVGPAGGLVSPASTEAEGEPLRFTNDLDIDETEDIIYFTDSSNSDQIASELTLCLQAIYELGPRW